MVVHYKNALKFLGELVFLLFSYRNEISLSKIYRRSVFVFVFRCRNEISLGKSKYNTIMIKSIPTLKTLATYLWKDRNQTEPSQ